MLTKVSKFAGIATAAASGLALVVPAQIFAAACTATDTTSISGGACGANPNPGDTTVTTVGGVFQTVTETLLYIIGAIAVIMLIIGGLQYVLSSGDSKRVESAKNTILFAIIGIVVATMAFVIVQFVTGKFGS